MYRYIVFTSIMLSITICGDCQFWGDSTIKKEKLFYSVEHAPKFPGGVQGFYKFISDSLKLPNDRFALFSERLVLVRIYLDKTGSIGFAEIVKSVNPNYDESVIELMKKMPKWEPGIQNGRHVVSVITIPVLFVD